MLKDVAFLQCDVPERDVALGHMRAGTLPDSPAVAPDISDAAQRPAPVTVGQHAGESESLAVAHRREVGILVTDKHAAAYARVRGISVESFLDALIRLIGKVPARDLYAMWKEANVHHYGGPGTVPGQQFFTLPTKAGSV